MKRYILVLVARVIGPLAALASGLSALYLLNRNPTSPPNPLWTNWISVITAVATIIIFAVLEWYTTFRPIKEIDKMRLQLLDRQFTDWLSGLTVSGQIPMLRATIMTKRRAGLFWSKLVTIYRYNMKGEPDENIEYSIGEGWENLYFKSLTKLGDPRLVVFEKQNYDAQALKEELKLSDAHIAQKSKVKTVATIALRREGTRLGEKPGYIGILNIEAINDAGSQLLNELKPQEIDRAEMLFNPKYRKLQEEKESRVKQVNNEITDLSEICSIILG